MKGKVICSKCGEALTEDSKFCGHCGNSHANQKTYFCMSCGHGLVENAKFCPNCGRLRGYKIVFCTNCGQSITENMKFCSRCGTKREAGKIISCPNCKQNLTKDNTFFCFRCGTKILRDNDNKESVVIQSNHKAIDVKRNDHKKKYYRNSDEEIK